MFSNSFQAKSNPSKFTQKVPETVADGMRKFF